MWDDEDELTIGLGEHHHWHASLYMYEDEPEAERPERAAAMAVAEIRSVLEGHTVLRITRRDGRVVSSSTYDPTVARMAALSAEESEYLWTGPRGWSP